ncbi:MAG: hypothetical protein ACPG8W_02300 [Candidatus Promineifilaceae bacterium]
MTNSTESKPSNKGLIAAAFLLVLVLFGAGSYLLRDSMSGNADATVAEPATTNEVVESESEGAGVDAPAGDSGADTVSEIPGKFTVNSTTSVVVKELSGSDFGQQLATETELLGSVYTINSDDDATGQLRLSVPDGADQRVVDMYGWNSGVWTYIPAAMQEREMVSAEIDLPQAVALVRTNQAEDLVYGAEVLPLSQVPGAIFPILSEVSVGTLTLGNNGDLLGEPVLIQPGSYNEYLRVTNTGLVVDSASLMTVLTDADIQQAHIEALVQRAFNGGYAGINVDYQGVPAVQSAAFNTFLTNLGDALHAQDRLMVVTVNSPELNNGQWTTYGHDLATVGQVADAVLLQAPLDPTVYGDNGLVEQMLTWATEHVDRYKLSLFLTANAVDQIGNDFVELPGELALANFGELQILQGSQAMQKGETIEVGLTGTASPLEWDGNGVTYRYNFEASGQDHTVWLANEGALAHRIRLADRFNLRGVMVRGLGGMSDGEGYTSAYLSLEGEPAPDSKAAALVWTVTNINQDVVASSTSSDQFTYAFPSGDNTGEFSLNVDFALGDNQTRLGTIPFILTDAAAEAEAAEEVAAADAEAADAETEEAAGDEAVDSAESEPAEEPASVGNAFGRGTVTIDTNYRQGPGYYYAIREILATSTVLDIEGRSQDGLWLSGTPVNSDKQGWVYAQLVQLDGMTLGDLPVIGSTATASVSPSQPTQSEPAQSEPTQSESVQPEPTQSDQTVASNEPTAEAVAQVTVWPTSQVTIWPTAQVTIWPTAQATKWPTVQATKWPTRTPLPQGPWAGSQQQQGQWQTATPVPPPAAPTQIPQPTAAPPTATPVPQATAVPPTAVPPTAVPTQPPAPPPAALGGGFELGGQTHHLGNPALMRDIGMTWVKFQHKWGEGDSGTSVADRIKQAHGNGLKVLLSMPGASTYPSSINAAAYVEFLRSVASLPEPPDAIEIWNEMNIDFEWPAGQISPETYVNTMLKPGYQAIKAANPSIMVVSGAPAPTGFDNNTNAWADDRYMAGVAAAGGGNYMDCIGVHYNAGATSPSQESGHPADGGARHYSWYYNGTLNMYYNAFGGARKVCFTEIGYLSTQGYPGTPQNFNWAANTTVQQHADWLAESTRLSANSGKVRFNIIFNIDFTHYDPNGDPQAGYAIIRPDGSCPACPLLKSVMGR